MPVVKLYDPNDKQYKKVEFLANFEFTDQCIDNDALKDKSIDYDKLAETVAQKIIATAGTLENFSSSDSSDITAANSVLEAIGKLAGKADNLVNEDKTFLKLNGTRAMTGAVELKQNNGGRIRFYPPSTSQSSRTMVLCNTDGRLRLHGNGSPDGTAADLQNSVDLAIDPTNKAITGGYSFDGKAATAGKADSATTATTATTANAVKTGGVTNAMIADGTIDLAKLNSKAKYGSYQNQTADFTLNINHGNYVLGVGKTDLKITVPADDSIPIGFCCSILSYANRTATITFNSSLVTVLPGDGRYNANQTTEISYLLPEYGMCSLQKITTAYWIISGLVEKV